MPMFELNIVARENLGIFWSKPLSGASPHQLVSEKTYATLKPNTRAGREEPLAN